MRPLSPSCRERLYRIICHMPTSTPATGTNALRRGRFSAENLIYHVTSCSRDRTPLFANFYLGRLVVKSMMDEDVAGQVYTLAFVVMPDHLHWLLQLTASQPLAIVVNKVKSKSARKINQQLACTGPVWQKGFHDRAIRRDEDIAAVARYIVANPLRSGIVRSLRDYPLWDAVWV